MRRVFAVAGVFSLFVLGASAASAEDCSPHCDYWHNYGPYDFSYIQPGLVGYPRCDARGQCSPYLVYVYPGHRHGRVTVRPVSRP
jgi:hypothetical protein